jgi:hypothetical protein
MALLFFLYPQAELASVAPLLDAVRKNLLMLKLVATYSTLISTLSLGGAILPDPGAASRYC